MCCSPHPKYILINPTHNKFVNYHNFIFPSFHVSLLKYYPIEEPYTIQGINIWESCSVQFYIRASICNCNHNVQHLKTILLPLTLKAIHRLPHCLHVRAPNKLSTRASYHRRYVLSIRIHPFCRYESKRNEF